MKFFAYLKYFAYLASNWSLRIALHIIKHERRGEKKYGIVTTGSDELLDLEDAGVDIEHATIYMPASYDVLEKIFTHPEIKNTTHLLDLGCGKGRAMAVAAHHGITKVTGIDFSPSLCRAAKENMELTAKQFPHLEWEVINNDAFYYRIPESVDCIFLFNPFDETIMSGVVENMNISLQKRPRTMKVVYLNPLNKELFTDVGFREVFHTSHLKYLEASILIKNAGA